MSCCRCNKTGRCSNCSCVKAGKLCHSCLPGRLSQCNNNTTTTTTTQFNSNSKIQTNTIANNTSVSSTIAATTTTSTTTTPSTNEAQNLNVNSSKQKSELGDLPVFVSMADPIFTWGSYDSNSFTESLQLAYTKVVHWKPNLFKLPQGKAGKSFVAELARLYKAFATGSALESIALKAVVVLPLLLLQNPSHRSKSKDQIRCIERRLILWKNGQLNDLLDEGCTLQKRLSNRPFKPKQKGQDPIEIIYK